MKTINIDQFNGIEVKIDYQKIVKEYAEKTKTLLQSPSVSPRSNRPNRLTPYWQGWGISHRYLKGGLRETVWNETNWQLTHLLENGHFITNGGALRWSPPKKHIKPTFDRVKPQYVRAMKKSKIDADFK